MKRVLEADGHVVHVVHEDRIGHMVYRDEAQVDAEPFADTRTEPRSQWVADTRWRPSSFVEPATAVAAAKACVVALDANSFNHTDVDRTFIFIGAVAVTWLSLEPTFRHLHRSYDLLRRKSRRPRR